MQRCQSDDSPGLLLCLNRSKSRQSNLQVLEFSLFISLLYFYGFFRVCCFILFLVLLCLCALSRIPDLFWLSGAPCEAFWLLFFFLSVSSYLCDPMTVFTCAHLFHLVPCMCNYSHVSPFAFFSVCVFALLLLVMFFQRSLVSFGALYYKATSTHPEYLCVFWLFLHYHRQTG